MIESILLQKPSRLPTVSPGDNKLNVNELYLLPELTLFIAWYKCAANDIWTGLPTGHTRWALLAIIEIPDK